MRVGIHSGRVLCGVLGKKKWQFDVNSNDVKLANHLEQSGTPGRVHITEDTMRALADRYQVEPAYGALRDTYIAERNMATYFVIPPANRRVSLAKPVGAAAAAAAAAAMLPAESAESIGGQANDKMVTQTSGQPITATAATTTTTKLAKGDADPELYLSQEQKRVQLFDQISSKSEGGRSVLANLGGKQQHPQQSSMAGGRIRFRQATQRIINALHFIRTIDAPFADFEPRPSETNIERSMHDTIVSRCQKQDIEPLTLKFKDPYLAKLYKSPSRLELIKRLLIFLSSLLCLVSLAYQTLPFATNSTNVQLTNDYLARLSGSSSSGGGGQQQQQQTNAPREFNIGASRSFNYSGKGGSDIGFETRATMENESTNNESPAGPQAAVEAVVESHHHHHHSLLSSSSSSLPLQTNQNHHLISLLLERSYFLMSEILLLFLITILVYMHQAEYTARRDFLWRQIALQDKDKMALMRDCNRFIFFNLLPPHVASYFLEQRLRSHMVSD